MSDSRDYKDSALSRIYREGAWPEPGRQIDQAILAASRRAAREQHSFARRWAPSFAIAATVVLTSTLVLKVYREQPEVASPSVLEQAQATRAKQAEANAPETNPAPAPAPQYAATPKGFSQTMDAAETERVERMQRDLALRQGGPASESLPAQKSAPADTTSVAAKKETSDDLQRRPASPPREQQPAGAPISVFGAAPSAPAPQSLRAASKPVLPFPPNKEAARPESVQPQAADALRMQAPPETAQAAPSPVPAGTTPAQTSPAANAAATSGGNLGAASLMAARAGSKTAERSAQTWIEDIRKLMTQGKSEEAGREIAEFKKRYPDYTLPEDL